MEVIELEKYRNMWDKFLSDNPHAIYHTPHWKGFIESSFNNVKGISLGISDGTSLKMIFPLYRLSHPIFGKRIISSAFHDLGGPIGECNAENLNGVLQHLKENYKTHNYLEIREHRNSLEKTYAELGLEKKPENKLFELHLADKEQTWLKIDQERRTAVRKARKNNLRARQLEKEDIDEIYSLYCENMRYFGTPPFHKRFFRSYWQNLVEKGLGKGMGVFLDKKLICAILNYNCSKKTEVFIGVSDYSYLKLRPNDLAYWEFIEWAVENNFDIFGFGRSREDSGQARFKLKWGCTQYDLNHFYLPIKSKAIEPMDPDKGFYRLATGCWKKLPLWLTKIIGPDLRKGFGI